MGDSPKQGRPRRGPENDVLPPRGRPPVHVETWSKVSVVLFDRQILHLDRLSTDIRGKSGKVLNRAEIIRALIDGLIDSGMDITQHRVRSRPARAYCAPPRHALSVSLSILPISVINSTP